MAADPKLERAMRQVGDNLGIMVAEGERLTALINDVLDLAKIEAGRLEWRDGPVDVGEIVERATAATAALFDQTRLELVVDVEAGLPATAGDEIVVAVADTEIGIRPEDHDRVWEPFGQAGDTLTDKPRGTGLGLPISREIVEHHGGRMWLESAHGVGSTFSFSLPVRGVAATPDGTVGAAAVAGGRCRGRARGARIERSSVAGSRLMVRSHLGRPETRLAAPQSATREYGDAGPKAGVLRDRGVVPPG